MQVFVIINNAGIMINAGVNVKNWLIKEFVINDLFGILVTVSMNVINHTQVGEYLEYENCKCKKKLVDELVDECTEAVEEVKLAKTTLAGNENKHECSSCTLYIVIFDTFCN